MSKLIEETPSLSQRVVIRVTVEAIKMYALLLIATEEYEKYDDLVEALNTGGGK